MIMPTDESYQKTKQLKQEGRPLLSPFREMAEWITEVYEVPVLNVLYETVIPDSRPRIEVIVETETHLRGLRSGALSNFTAIDERRVRERFASLLAGWNSPSLRTDGLFVIFSAFEPVARIEVISRLTEGRLDQFRERLRCKELWRVVGALGGVTFFFYTTEQIAEWERSGLRDVWTRELESLVEPLDEFGYFRLHPSALVLDSKENFDRNYNGNWFNYFR